jgi:hypothetical protein
MRRSLAMRFPECRELEIREYIEAFKTSSDRSRYLIYINAVVSLLILISTWNTTQLSWARRRLDMAEKVMTSDATSAQRLRAEGKALTEAALLKEKDEKYVDAALPRIWFVPVPGLGVNIHVNDLGILGGMTLSILATLLCLSMVRQHENLYLALFKVRRICELERITKHDGESMANFLYHSLAMGQVLNYPPTLARWTHGTRNRIIGLIRWSILCLPAMVQAIVVGYNLRTVAIGRQAWGPIVRIRMGAQLILLVVVATMCLMAGIYSRACNYRWRSAFNMINPGLSSVEPRQWLDWVRLRRSRDIGPPFLLAELTYSFQPANTHPVLKAHEIEGAIDIAPLKKPIIGQDDLVRMSAALHQGAAQEIGADMVDHIESWEVKYNAITKGTWRVRAICRYGVDGG